MYQTTKCDPPDEIDNLISVIRARITFGQTKFEIGKELGRKYSQEKIHLAYIAAELLLNDNN